jgi:hypothetical protein
VSPGYLRGADDEADIGSRCLLDGLSASTFVLPSRPRCRRRWADADAGNLVDADEIVAELTRER